MSQREYAKRRGVSHVAVQRAVSRGRLRDSVRDGKIIDPELADREWDENTSYSEAPRAVAEQAAARLVARGGSPPASRAPEPGADGISMAEASRLEKVWKARQAELQYKQKARELVPADEVRGTLQDAFSECRTKLLGLASRIRQQVPHLTGAEVATIEALVRETLETLANGERP